jgi:hypothetical protein
MLYIRQKGEEEKRRFHVIDNRTRTESFVNTLALRGCSYSNRLAICINTADGSIVQDRVMVGLVDGKRGGERRKLTENDNNYEFKQRNATIN